MDLVLSIILDLHVFLRMEHGGYQWKTREMVI
jgi:hypothetical protein